MKTTTIPHSKRHLTFGPFCFESGQTLDEITLTYETWGTLNADRSNAVMIAHALTGTSHAASSEEIPYYGWWEYLIGPGKVIDTRRYFVICSNVLSGCSGSSGPASINPNTGKPYAMSFPVVTIRDMVHAQKHLLDHLKIDRLLTILGASMGGMQALEWAAIYPECVESIIPISTPGRAYPQSIAYRKSQRKAIMMDPLWNNGNYYGGARPKQGIELARLIGFISYRTEKEFAHRFGREHRDASIYDIDGRFEVESYLEHHGKKLAQWFDANTYLYLSKAMDLHDMGFGFSSYKDGLQRIHSKVLMLGVNSDILFPCYQQKEIVNILKEINPNVAYREINSLYGHDAFLVEEKQVADIIADYLNKIESDSKNKVSLRVSIQ